MKQKHEAAQIVNPNKTFVIHDPNTVSDGVLLELAETVKKRPMVISKNERLSKGELEGDGWTVLRHGSPDFLCFKVDPKTNEFTIRSK